MGRLRYLEIENFKSYAGKHIIGPFDDFTCIVGPNGSGKSNLMDAISFVLGVQSRQLRSSHNKELVFRKDSRKPNGADGNGKRASVKLVYEVGESESEVLSGGNISFCRLISPTGVSTYRIDDKEVTYEAYEKQLQAIGVLVKVRNFLVFQGDVESVASKSPMELTKMLEQICGSDVHRAEYEELLKKKIEADDKFVLTVQNKKFYGNERKAVKDQKDEAERYMARKSQLEEFKTEYTLLQLLRIKNSVQEQRESVLHSRKELEQIKVKEDDLEQEINTLKSSLAKVNKNLSGAESEYAQKELKMAELTPKLLALREKLKSSKRKQEENEKGKKRMQVDIEEQNRVVEGLVNDLAQLKTAEAIVEREMNQDSASSDSATFTPDRIKEYHKLKLEAAAVTAIDKTASGTLENDIVSKKQRMERLMVQEKLLLKQSESDESVHRSSKDRSDLLAKAIETGKKDLDVLNKARVKMDKDIAAGNKRLEELNRSLEELQLKLREIGDERRRNKNEEKMNEAILTLKKIYGEVVHGKFSELIDPTQKAYSQAVSVAMGKHLDAIIVENASVAKDCIRYLRDQHIGVCSFIPLDNISQYGDQSAGEGTSAHPITPVLRQTLETCTDSYVASHRGSASHSKPYHFCADLVQCHDRYRNAVVYAVGATVVCDSLQHAQYLCFDKNVKVKAVTMTGHVISKSGAMTGGSVSGSSGGRFEEKEVEKMRAQKDQLEKDIQSLKLEIPTRNQVIDMEVRCRKLQNEVNYSESDKKVNDEKVTQSEIQLNSKRKALEDLRAEGAALAAEVQTLEAQKQVLYERISAAEKKIFASFSASIGVNDICEFENQKLKKHEELLKRKHHISERTAQLTSQLAYERQRDFESALAVLEKKIKENAAQIQEMTKSIDAMVAEEENLAELKRVHDKKVQDIKKERDGVSTAIKTLQNKRSTFTQSREGVAKKLSGYEISVEQLRAQLHEVMEKALLEEVALPIVRAKTRGSKELDIDMEVDTDVSDDDLTWSGTTTNGDRTADSTSSTHFSQTQNPTVVKDAALAAKVDLSGVRRMYRNAQVQLEREQFLARTISNEKIELTAMKPNMHALEKYEDVADKLKQCNEEYESAKNITSELDAKFESVKAQRRALFQDCFQHVSQALSVIYKDLTKSSKHPLGGNAYLMLESTGSGGAAGAVTTSGVDEPYLSGLRYTAMPPMKRFRDMDQLSGGERTVAALALLFAIHSYRQAPFFVMDEIDAALDNVNIKKVCNYIRQRSKDFQCIVISLKDEFFEHADSLIGTCKDLASLSSRVLTLKLNDYQQVIDPAEGDSEYGGSAYGKRNSYGSAYGRSSVGSVFGAGRLYGSFGSQAQGTPMADTPLRSSVGTTRSITHDMEGTILEQIEEDD